MILMQHFAIFAKDLLMIVQFAEVKDLLTILSNTVLSFRRARWGDTIYQTDGVRIYTSTIYEITYTANKVIFVTENVVFDERAINNSIFLTREEAEKR